MIYVGIDPGISGGVAALDATGHLVLAEAMPTCASPVAGRKMVDAVQLAAMLRGSAATTNRMRVALERVGAMPRNGAVSMFSFGQSYGTVIGVLGALACSWDFVAPQDWKRHHRLGSDKGQSLALATRLWPDLHLRKKDDGIAEAVLIAEWLRLRQEVRPNAPHERAAEGGPLDAVVGREEER